MDMDMDMDSTPNPNPQPQPQLLSVKASASKLPIKRKIPSPSNPNPKPEPTATDDEEDDDDVGGGGGGGGSGGGRDDRNPPPFKFHRIWTEPDEIRFLQGLLDCSSDGLSFPRDLGLFYARFSNTTSHPYTKSQLSEKLRRLRKKFRVVSSRLAARGLDWAATLSPHDRALFELSRRLWHPDFDSSSPFGAGNNLKKSNLVGVRVSFSPTLPPASIPVSNQSVMHEICNPDGLSNDNGDYDSDHGAIGVDCDGQLSEVHVEFDGAVQEQELSIPCGSSGGGDLGRGFGEVVSKTVINVFDQSLKEVRTALDRDQGSSMEGEVDTFEKRWREQRVAELDVVARRLRLVLEHSLQRQ